MSLSLCLCFWAFWLLLFTHTAEKTAPWRVCVKLLRIKIYARLGGKTVSNDATRGRVQAAEAWLTVRRLLCFRLWHFSFWTVKSEALLAAASESDRFTALCAEILPDISTLALFSRHIVVLNAALLGICRLLCCCFVFTDQTSNCLKSVP